jgi:hypothetical protein
VCGFFGVFWWWWDWGLNSELLGFELRAHDLRASSGSVPAILLALFVLVIFWTGSCSFASAGLHCELPTSAFHRAGMTGLYNPAQLIS